MGIERIRRASRGWLAVVWILGAGTQWACGGGSSPTSPSPSLPGGGGNTGGGTPAQIAGQYTVNVRSSAVCPSPVNRTWDAGITQAGATVTINVLGAIQAGATSCTLQGSAMTCAGIGWADSPTASSPILVVGAVQATVSGNTINGTMNGQVGGQSGQGCNAIDHVITFTRR